MQLNQKQAKKYIKMKKLLLIIFTAIIATGCEKSETKLQLQETNITELSQGYILSSEFNITEIKVGYKSTFFTLTDEKYKFVAEVISGTTYKVGDKITGIELNAILSKNNYQIPSF